MACLVQVGTGSGGMAVLDLVGRDARINSVLLIEPDIYKPHNVVRHYFAPDRCGQSKVDLAANWLKERRPDLLIETIKADLCDPSNAEIIDHMIMRADIGICAVDNDKAKMHWDWLMRKHGKPWTLGEVLAGGIGGFVHMFVPGGPCYGCVMSHLQRNVKTNDSPAPDYSAPNHSLPEVSIPASMASIHAIASIHALATLALLGDEDARGWDATTHLIPLRGVPGIFERALASIRLPFSKLVGCLQCTTQTSEGDLEAAFAAINAGAIHR